MSALFTGVSNTSLDISTSPRITAAPFTIGCWARATTLSGFPAVWSVSNGAAGGSGNITLVADTGGWTYWDTVALVAAAGSIAANRWDYILFRWVSATNRHISVVTGDG